MTRRELAIRTVKQVSRFLTKQYGVVRTADVKKDGTLVTSADLGAEQLLLCAIKKHFPLDGILSEECGEIKTKNGYQWILDPLDGTHNFLGNIPLFGTLVGLQFEGETVLGVCDFPMAKEFFVAEKGRGATLNGRPIHVNRKTVSEKDFFLSDGNSQGDRKKMLAVLKRFYRAGFRVRVLGSSAFCMTRVAMGLAVAATLAKGKPWDIVAPAFVVEEAGGRVTEPSGKKWSSHSLELVATNGRVHERVLRLIS